MPRDFYDDGSSSSHLRSKIEQHLYINQNRKRVKDNKISTHIKKGKNSYLHIGQVTKLPADFELATITTSAMTGTNAIGFTATAVLNFIGTGGTSEVGFVWSTSDTTPTLTNDSSAYHSIPTVNESFAFTYNSISSGDAGTVHYGRAYATTSYGTSYGAVKTFTPFICLARGTLITLYDYSVKPIEEIKYTDMLLVWNFDTGEFTQASPLWIKQSETATCYNVLEFSDGTVLKTIEQHRIFNKQAGSFTYPMTDDTPLGTITMNYKGKEIVLVNKYKVYENMDYFNVITNEHINLYANGILTSCRYNNIYPIENMRFIKQINKNNNTTTTTISLEEYNEVAKNTIGNGFQIASEYYYGMRLGEQSFPVKDTVKYIKRLVDRAVPKPISLLFLDHQGVMCTTNKIDIGGINITDSSKQFNKEAVQTVNSILDNNSEMQIVVSSDWRYWVMLPEMQDFYLSQGITKKPIGYTSYGKYDNPMKQPIEMRRANEILA
jgi:hypothetical protein